MTPIDNFGALDMRRVVALLRADLAAARQLIGMTPAVRVIDMTGNRRRQTVAVLDSEQLVLLPLTIAEVRELDARSNHV
jgi:regulator of extracellular matrix RemA (YlzA/DUF370 family)